MKLDLHQQKNWLPQKSCPSVICTLGEKMALCVLVYEKEYKPAMQQVQAEAENEFINSQEGEEKEKKRDSCIMLTTKYHALNPHSHGHKS